MDTEKIKKDFPIFDNGDIVYLDSGATSQKPKCVIEASDEFYKNSNANPYRGAYSLSIKATEIYNEARHTVAEFLNAKNDEEIVFTKNATESLNLVAYSYGFDNLKENDEVVLSIMEHHSMIVPWQKITTQTHSKLKYMYIDSDYKIPDVELEKITKNTKVVGISSVSNALGVVNDVQKIVKKAHSVGAVVIVDISQSVAHSPFDAQKIDADFVAFSGHKMFGPLGIGVLYGKKELLQKMSPFIMGGDMIEYVYEDYATFADIPNKFEAGTQNVAGAVGLKKAIEYINSIGFDEIEKHERDIISYAYNSLKKLPFVIVYASNDKNISSCLSFNVLNIHPHDVATILDADNVFIRTGNHCAQPLMRFLKLDSTCRLSISIYNTKQDIDRLVESLKKVYEKFKKYIKVK